MSRRVHALPIALLLLAIPARTESREEPHAPPPSVEAEAMTIVSSVGGSPSVQDMAGKGFSGRWSGGKQLFWRAESPNAWLALSFASPVQGLHRPVLHYTQAPDYGVFEVRFGDQRVAVVDGHAPGVVHTYLRLPERSFASGEQVVLKLGVFHRDERSVGFFVGLDRLVFEPIDRTRDPTPRAGVCAAGGAHEAAVDAPTHALPEVARCLMNGRWCFKCGAAFLRDPRPGAQRGGACTALDPPAGGGVFAANAMEHLGNANADKMFLLAPPVFMGPRCFSCDRCHALYTLDVLWDGKSNMCGSAKHDDHKSYKGDVYELTPAPPSDGPHVYRVCARCSTVYSTNDQHPSLDAANPNTVGSDCPVLASKGGGPHQPLPGKYYQFAPWPPDAEAYWARCQKCQTLYFVPDVPGAAGRCPCGGTHDGGWGTFLALSPAPVSAPAGAWMECRNCQALFTSGEAWVGGQCSAGGAHGAGGKALAHAVKLPAPESGGGAWRRCAKCSLLFFRR